MNINFGYYVKWAAAKHSLTIKIGEGACITMTILFYGLPGFKKAKVKRSFENPAGLIDTLLSQILGRFVF